jgi:beta-glucosidase
MRARSSLLVLCSLVLAGALAPAHAGGAEATVAAQRWQDRSLSSDARAALLVAELTLDEKIQLVHGVSVCGFAIPPAVEAGLGGDGFTPGIPRLGIPALNYVGGGAGVTNCGRRSDGQATALPAPLALAASWDERLAGAVGGLIGRETRAQGFNVSLGGAINLVREPRGGRSFEYYGEDPLLAGRLIAPQLRAIQREGVIATVKHFVGNEQESGREHSNSIIDERALRELYLQPFEIAVREARPGIVMCAYNKLNGIYSCEHDALLNGVLKGEWGFRGWVQSDWGATHSTAAAANAGLDEEQFAGEYFAQALKQAVERGEVPPSRLDEMVQRKLRAMIAVGLLDGPALAKPIDARAGDALAQRVAEQGIVLLKNEAGALPLQAAELRSIAVIGRHADVGVLSGGGSAQVDPRGGPAVPIPPPSGPPPHWPETWLPSAPLAAIRAQAPEAELRFDAGADPSTAAALAARSDVAIVFVASWRVEGQDLPNLSLPAGQDELIAAVAAANPHTVVVLQTGGPTLMPWLGEVPAVLAAWYPGIRGAEAIAAVLFGEVNPSGKLPISFPRAEADLPMGATPPQAGDVVYAEGLQMGYRWYDSRGIQPLFPFGHGLSYTAFRYAELQVTPQIGPGEPALLTFLLTNVGERAGAEVAQVYLGLPASAGAPQRLAGWVKLRLKPGQTTRVFLRLPPRQLAIWNADTDAWEQATGSYRVWVGASSRDRRLSASLRLTR